MAPAIAAILDFRFRRQFCIWRRKRGRWTNVPFIILFLFDCKRSLPSSGSLNWWRNGIPYSIISRFRLVGALLDDFMSISRDTQITFLNRLTSNQQALNEILLFWSSRGYSSIAQIWKYFKILESDFLS